MATAVEAGQGLEWTPEPEPEPRTGWRAYPLAFGSVARRIWAITEPPKGARWTISFAVPAILVAWLVVAAWLLTAAGLERLYDRTGWRRARGLLLLGVEHPWVGFTIGAIEVTFIAEWVLQVFGRA